MPPSRRRITTCSIFTPIQYMMNSVDNLTYYPKGIHLAATEPGPLVLKRTYDVEMLWSGLLLSKT